MSVKNRNLILRLESGQQREEPSDKRYSRLSGGGREDATLTMHCSFPQCSASRKKTPSMCVLVSLFFFLFGVPFQLDSKTSGKGHGVLPCL